MSSDFEFADPGGRKEAYKQKDLIWCSYRLKQVWAPFFSHIFWIEVLLRYFQR
ncbi:hypothetical protein D3C87_1393270 [compost metagenome]